MVRAQSLVSSKAMLQGRFVFLSASIPSDTWQGEFDAYQITAAAVEAVKATLYETGRIVCAAHPTVAPLVLTASTVFPADPDGPRVVVYQSELFRELVPAQIHEIAQADVGELRWTPASPGETPEPGNRDESLRIMREQMITDSDPAAAIFIGGMEGITVEFKMFRHLFPDRPVYPLGHPGGESRALVKHAPPSIGADLAGSDAYPWIMRRVVEDLADRLASSS